MNGIDIRCKQLRLALGMSQTDFGAKVGVEYSVIRNIENGITTLKKKPKLSNLICQMFDVNKEWLETGLGDMFLDTETAEIEHLSTKYNLSEIESQILKNYLDMDESQRHLFTEMLLRLSNPSCNIPTN